MFNWLKHAFAIETADMATPSITQADTIDLVCREVIRRQMTLPAQMVLESSAPLHYLSGQLLRFAEPMLGTILDATALRDFASFLERRGAVEYICQRLEELQEKKADSSAADDVGVAKGRGPKP